jgi:heme-degrading monooxygenase HmoA
MFVVIFEVQPKKERWDDYLALAKQLKPKLEAIDGFIDNERFASKRTTGRLLSLSTWRDEKAVIRWRTHGVHHDVQEKGRFEVFEDYHLRVGEVTAGAGTLPARLGLDASAARGLVDHELFESIYASGKFLLLASWRDAGAADAWQPTPIPAAQPLRHRQVRIIRDYGMFDRREAPQFYPAVNPRPAGP